MLEELPRALKRMLDLWNGAGIDPGDIYARGCSVNGGAETFDPEEVAAEVAVWRASFPDLRFTVEASFAACPRYVLRLEAAGTHTGTPFRTEIGTAKASGQRIMLQGIEVFEIRNDKIVDVWIGWNWAAVYAALGATL